MTDTTSTGDVERPPLTEIEGIRYLGHDDERVISVLNLGAIGVQAKHDLIWHGHGDVVATSLLNAATVDFLVSDTAEFELVTIEKS
jgi:hypothetical protein